MLSNEPLFSVFAGLTPGSGSWRCGWTFSIIEILVNVFIPLSYLNTPFTLNTHIHVNMVGFFIDAYTYVFPTSLAMICQNEIDNKSDAHTYIFHRSGYIDMYTLPKFTFFFYLSPSFFLFPIDPSPKPHHPTPPTQNKYTYTDFCIIFIYFVVQIFHISISM